MHQKSSRKDAKALRRPLKKFPGGLLITFEGSEGCGKSTQIRRLASFLKKLNYSVFVTREPGGTSVGERVRHLLKFSKSNGSMFPETELMLFTASRTQLVREKILPHLSQGTIVLCDRFIDSTLVYQGIGRKLDLNLISTINRFATTGRKPNLTFVLDFDVVQGLGRARKKTKTKDRMEMQKRRFYDLVRRGFRDLAHREPGRVKLIDASKSISEVAEKIREYVRDVVC